MTYKLLLDAGHNASVWGTPLTPGKRSPEIPPGFYEGDFNRRICYAVWTREYGDDIIVLNPGPIGKTLKDRVKDVNRLARIRPCILLSVHANAADNSGKWSTATGTTVFVHPNASPTSILFAQLLRDHMHRETGLKKRGIKRANFAMLRAKCPAVLLECLFMTNKQDILIPHDDIARAIYYAYANLVEGE